MQNTTKLVVVTGANKGIGYQIVQKLLTNKQDFKVVLAARNPTLGEEAVKQLQEKYSKEKNTV